MDRFFVPPGTLQSEHVELGGELSHRLRHVLRLRAGDRVILFGGSGFEYEVALDDTDGPSIGATVLGRSEGAPEPKVRVVLYQSVVKGERFDWLLEKGTEIGVARFVPLLASRAVVRPGEERSEKRERWLRIVTEAAEQCGRSRLPELAPVMPLDEALSTAEGLRLFLWEREEDASLRQALRRAASEGKAPAVVSIFIGPEGGFTQEEADAAVAAGARSVSLGRRILRSETAGIVAVAAVLYELGELGA
ncbi:MAG: 16S rRNA (uracil(1498)-N(3))-methyltransferase [Dehalococcoidia bacterium]|jgi:16S rRNA (uracil1498-N3)-methyltransferase